MSAAAAAVLVVQLLPRLHLPVAMGLFVIAIVAIAAARPWIKRFIFRQSISRAGRPLTWLFLCQWLLIFSTVSAGMSAMGVVNIEGRYFPLLLALIVSGLLAAASAFRSFPLDLQRALAGCASGQVLESRRTIWMFLSHLSRLLETQDEVLVTALEDAPVHYVEENDVSELFMAAWHERVMAGVRVKQVVRVFDNTDDIVNLEQRVKKFSNRENVELGVLFAPAPSPLLDVYIVAGRYAVVSYSTSAATPALMTDAILVTAPEAVRSMTAYFKETLWAQAEPLKTAVSVNHDVLEDLSRAIDVVREAGDKQTWKEIPALVARGGPLASDILRLVQALRDAAPTFYVQPDSQQTEETRSQLRTLTTRIKSSLPDVKAFGSSLHALKSDPPGHSLRAVSLIDNEAYWTSLRGRDQMVLEAELTGKGISIQRLFIVPTISRLSSVMLEVFSEQLGYAGADNIMMIERSDAMNRMRGNPLNDFAIVDSKFVVSDTGGQFRRYSQPELVKASVQSFRDLLEGARSVTQPAPGPADRMRTETRRTVVSVDLVGYSDVQKLLEEQLGTESASAVDRQIDAFVRTGLEDSGGSLSENLYRSQGDGALLVFATAAHSIRFAKFFFKAVDERNAQKSLPSARRHFRLGAATGLLMLETFEGSIKHASGSVIARCKRLETAAESGELVLDVDTYKDLDGDFQMLCSGQGVVPGKRDEAYEVRRLALDLLLPKEPGS